MKETLKCIIKIVSPVHIGCDDVYEPTGFVVDEENKHLIQFNPSLFISELETKEREKLSQICKKGTVASILELYKFFRGKKAEGRRVELCTGFMDHYRKTLQIPENNSHRINQELNKFTIARTAYRPSDTRPYIPGSSVKGSLRTGYLNHLCQGKRQSGRDIEKDLLNYRQIDEDPFGKVKVSDFQPVGDVKTKIVYAVNQKKKISDKDAGGPYQIFEVIQPGAVFTGEITVNDVHEKSSIREAVKLDTLIYGTGRFYSNENIRENEELSRVGIPPVKFQENENISKNAPTTGYRIIPLRIGRHSGAESVTIEGNRSIKIMLGRGNRPKIMDHATTLWLASQKSKSPDTANLLPFGWSCIEEISVKNENDFDIRENEYLQKSVKEAEKKIQIAEQRLKEEKEAEKKAQEKKAELKRLKEEEEKKKKILEEMTPEERFLVQCDDGSVTGEEINSAYKNIDKYSDEYKKEVAVRLKKHWQDNKNWTKKDVGQKKWKKIRERNTKLDEIIND
ncbi:MAG: type III-A CRISPR-associated RAMP protein Csm5 [Thermodesulfobacteriota bacterium]|nr:type III-A CRISPR-associated RAMP protein Csm5 [Thermodesulfobacteriota bacterium]